ncbi:DNA-binding GntR family transcriptional regulator [Arthrobacter sp. SLBN-100]|uniref:GntR family transcriptional regulator n=1 Tax=Arthrobacter sp. SLBN-100 TaxID=2768450 RepID=UPI0011722367|nr:GntR family transcriptional regulator [Arthrobacter sp. SLBN-100]TQJ62094.1 DNA-binding GntR family transcriptional regulator [Arthrobacter sp. SLBN-100]
MSTAAKQTSADAVFEAVRDEVLAARVPPGAKMKLVEYSERFGASLSVVREAMSRLAEQGLLQAYPNRGFSTMPLTLEDLLNLTRARIVIETGALRESIARGSLAWEAKVVAAHHQLAATPMHRNQTTINADFAAMHRDFHVALLAGSGNSHLESIAASLRDRSQLYQYWSQHVGNDPGRDLACEHRVLAELAVARKTDEACDALERHIQRTTDALLEYAQNRQVGAAAK